ncbi:MAG: tRNA A-37 threonylcarbamoyl transferase component Bud32, partial [Gammaproteobacteria bacterium]
LFVAASELAGDESAELSDFVKSNVEQLAARSIDPADLIKVWDNSLHQDWQIRESAIRSIGQSGKRESINQLKLVLGQYPESAVAILKAVSMLGFAKGGEIGFSCLKMSEALVQREALLTIGSLATKKYGEAIRDKLMQYVPKLQSTVRDTAGEVIVALTERFDMSPLQVDSEKYFETRLTRIEETSAENKSSGQTAQATAPTEIVRFQNIEELKKGDLWMDRFRIDREIGRGAMGRVMLAADEMVGEPLILKFMHPELTADGGARERFLREVKYSRKVSHNNVIRIHDMLFKDNLCAISMEYFESRGIDEFLREKKYFKPREGLEVLRQVSDGMAAAHLQNVIHRDLKPSNILMNAAGLVKVVDFGIASASTSSDSTLTKTGSIIGTPAYLSPERAKGYEAHNRCDVYALGIIAYCLFTGQLPYRGEPMSLLFQHLEGNAKPAIEVRREIGIKVSKFIQKMMAVDAEDRFQSMDEVSEAITKLLSKMGW